MPKPIAWAALPMLALLLQGCVTTRLTPTTKPGNEPLVCTVWQPIYYDHLKDRQRTIDQIRMSNARRDSYCK